MLKRKSYLLNHLSTAPDICFCQNKTQILFYPFPCTFCSDYSLEFPNIPLPNVPISKIRAVGRVGFFRRKSQSRLRQNSFADFLYLLYFSIRAPGFFSILSVINTTNFPSNKHFITKEILPSNHISTAPDICFLPK